MLKVYDIVRIESVKEPRQISPGNHMIDMVIMSKSFTKKNGEIEVRDDCYDAVMYMSENHLSYWKGWLQPGAKLFLKDAELEGWKQTPENDRKGWVKVRLSNSIRNTIIID